MSIVSLITDPQVGGTFLTWSLEFLSGKNRYFNFKTGSWRTLCQDPLAEINAHVFEPNQPFTLNQLRLCYDKLENISDQKKHFVYFHNLINEKNTYPVDPMIDASAVALTFEKTDRCLMVSLSSKHALYHCKQSSRALSRKWNSQESNKSFDEQNQNDIEYFFGDHQKYWRDDLNLNQIWDQREFLALNLRPFKVVSFNKDLFVNQNCLMLTAEECFFYFDDMIDQIFQYIDVGIDKSRWKNWHSIYKRWQQLHRDRMRFCWYFDEIIHAIINNIQIDLARFDLDLYREAAIQHVLLYHHNLNLRTYQLEKFHNTRQLHNLLEPNIHHRLEKLY
jgi:hypothetical protein